jgi:hypothetical protein
MLLPRAEAIENKDPNNLVTGISANQLLGNIIEPYGLLLAQRKIGSNKPTLIKKEDPDIEDLSLETKDNPLRRGRRYELRKDDFTVGFVQVGVFIDHNEAYKVFSDHILHTSMGPNKKLGAELTEKSVGWWEEKQKGYARVLFVRDNTVVDIYLFLKKYIDLGGKARSSLDIAKAIDASLLEGSHGVKRGSVVRVPRILAVEKPQRIYGGTETQLTVQILVPRALDKAGDYEIARPIQFQAPKAKDKKTLEYEISYITPDCVVVSKRISVVVEAKGKVSADSDT